MKTIRLAQAYMLAGYPKYAERAATCGTFLQFGLDHGGEKHLAAANFCQLRLCPMCTARRARWAAFSLSKIMSLAQEVCPGLQYTFLTLTIRNVSGDKLGEAVGELIRAWYRMTGRRRFEKAVRGWFRAVEITRSKDGTYHPHIHVVLAVDPAYFDRKKDLYISQTEWREWWQKSLRADYAPMVRIQAVKDKAGRAQGMAAALEAAKYTTKDVEYLSRPLLDGNGVVREKEVQTVRDYTEALKGRRLTAFGGCLKDAAKRLKAEDFDKGDLIYADDEIRSDLYELMVTYGWNFGAGDYVLRDVQSATRAHLDS